MDSAERKRRSREKMKQNPDVWRRQLLKEKERSHRRREKAKEERSKDAQARELWKEKERLRKKKYREKKKTAQLESTKITPLGSYKCKNTLRKATMKTKRALPESPRKKEAVISQLVKDFLPALSPRLFQDVKGPRSRIVSTENIKNVKSFFERDDISRAAPGRKDTISIKDTVTGKRAHVAKRHMIMSVAEAYRLFKEEYPSVKVGKSKFFEVRPPHVRPMSEMPHNVCVCVYHANFEYLVEVLHKNIPDFPSTSRELVSEITCDVASEKCMSGECQTCFEIYDIVKLKLDQSSGVSWKQWMKQDNQLRITTISGTLKVLLTEMHKQTAKFKHHVFVKNQQAKYFENKKKETSSTEIVLQVDFAENFTILSQDEIQSAHWAHPQATMFTGCSWGNMGEEKHSYIVISNELSHDKCTVWVFLHKIIQDLKIHYPSLKKVLIFSDGCAAQFKNRFTLSNICHSKSNWGVDVEWSFFASSHGKGAVDGVGATAKRMLWSAIMSRKAIINNSWECFNYLKSKDIKGMHIFFIAVADIDIHRENLQSRWTLVQPIPHLQKHHHFKALDCSTIRYGITSNSSATKQLLLNKRGKLKYNDIYTSSETDMHIDEEV